MKISRIIALGLFMIVGIIGLTLFWKNKKGHEQGVYVLNILDKEFYDDCHIAGSIHVPFDQLEKFVAHLEKESVEIIVYCSNYRCSSSGYAYKQLKKLGFKHVWMYEGGMAEWYQMGYPVEGMCKQSYLTIQISPPDYNEMNSDGVITAQQLARKLNLNVAA